MSTNPSATEINRLMTEAGKALAQGRLDDAECALKRALVANPDHADAQYLYGVTCLMGGRATPAADWLRKAVAQRPADANMQTYLGCALHDAGASGEALIHLRRACELAPRQPKPSYNLGKALKEMGQLRAADEAFRRTLRLDPQHVLARIGAADIATMQGDISRAVAEYRHVLRNHPERAEAWHGLANLKTETLGPADIELIRRALGQPNLPPDTRVLLGFSLFRALEDQHDYAGAFAALRQANADKRRMVHWDASAERAQSDQIMQAFSGPLPTPLDATLGREVIFIASMPRSGSTLVEHILATHPHVEGANEIGDLPQVIEDESRRRGQPFPRWVNAATADDWNRPRRNGRALQRLRATQRVLVDAPPGTRAGFPVRDAGAATRNADSATTRLLRAALRSGLPYASPDQTRCTQYRERSAGTRADSHRYGALRSIFSVVAAAAIETSITSNHK
jgi:Flp pilus assembly protein TadD